MGENIPFLIVDDDESILTSMKALINKAFPNALVFVASEGLYATDFILNKLNSLAIILCDLNLPGLNGLQILEKMRANEKTKDNYFILMTAGSDNETKIKALQKGVDEFITKPFEIIEVISKLRNGHKRVNLISKVQEKEKEIGKLEEEKKQTNNRLKNLLRQFQSIRMPELSNQLKVITEIAIWILTNYSDADQEKMRTIADAASLAFIGKVYLSDKHLSENVSSNGLLKNEIMQSIPSNAKEILSHIGNFEEATKIIYHIYENFDGSGFPEKIKSWQIPLGSRILRVLLDYLEMGGGKIVESTKSIEQLTHECNRIYDFKVVALFDQYFANHLIKSRRSNEMPIRKVELKEGMIISRNVITESGVKLIASGIRLSEESLKKLIEITENDSIIGKIYIRDMGKQYDYSHKG